MSKETKRITFDAPKDLAEKLEEVANLQETSMRDTGIRALVLYFAILEKGGKLTFEDGSELEVFPYKAGRVIKFDKDGKEVRYFV